MAWVIDTNIVVLCLRGKSPLAMRRLHAMPASEIYVPLQVQAELLLGAAKSAKPLENRVRVIAFLSPFQLKLPTPATVEEYVSIRAHLERQGIVIGEADMWIAATARELGAAMVTKELTLDAARLV